MLPREDNYILKWEARQGKGKWSYMILVSLVWGTLMPLLVISFRLAWAGELHIRQLQAIVWSGSYLLIWALCLLGVFTLSLMFWHLARSKYLSLKRKQLREQSS